MKKKWSKKEERFLSKHPMMSGKDMAEKLNRTTCSVSGKRYKMRIATKKSGENHPRSKITAEQAEMMRVLNDAGFKAGKIKSFCSAVNDIKVQSVDDVINYRTWRG